MVNRVVLTLDQQEYNALLEIAVNELRNPSDQARIIVRRELSRRGLLTHVVCNPNRIAAQAQEERDAAR